MTPVSGNSNDEEGRDVASDESDSVIDPQKIDALAAEIAPKRPCGCDGARGCGCWNLAFRLLAEARACR